MSRIVRVRRSKRNPVVRRHTAKPTRVIRYSLLVNNVLNHKPTKPASAPRPAQKSRSKKSALSPAKAKQLAAKKAAQTKRRLAQKRRELRRKLIAAIPLATIVSYLAYRFYGLARTFAR